MNCLLARTVAAFLLSIAASLAAPTNVLLITVDDMSCDSVGVYGNSIPNITPNIDKLASEGLRFKHGHVTVAICQPCRAVWMTGRYPHNSGALGFDNIRPGIPTLPEALNKAGYRTGLMAKHGHVIPSRAAAFDEIVPARELKNGRSPELFGQRAAEFFDAAKKENKPFFLMANSQDPHRPFIGSEQEANAKKRDHKNKSHQYGGGFPDDKAIYDPANVPVPGFLPDLPDIRLELSQYYSSVHRADAIVGSLLKALDEAGLRESTLVMFLSDHGMPLPYAKTNCWHHSTRTPWIVRWPGTVKAGSHDTKHLVGGIDLTPTLLDALGLPNLSGADGRSFLPILRGEQQTGRDILFTHINTIASKRAYTMRAAVTREHRYLWNGWHDGETTFKNESLSGLSWKAMTEAAKEDASIAARVEFYAKRVPQEFYQTDSDPDCLKNLIEEPTQQNQIVSLRSKLHDHLKTSNDPQLESFQALSTGQARKRVLILGDSTSMRYGPVLKKLYPEVDIHRPQGNHQGTVVALQNLDRWIGDSHWDVIHFNFGLHDFKHVDPKTGESSSNEDHPLWAPPDDYRTNLESIVVRLQKTGAILIFATTTPVPADEHYRVIDHRMSPVYNKIALEIMKERGIAINDLYHYTLPNLKEWQQPKDVHFHKLGTRKIAEKVKESIQAELAKVQAAH